MLFDTFKDLSDDEKIEAKHKALVELALHAAVEEKLVYPLLREEDEDDEVNEAIVEHHVVKLLLVELYSEDHSNGTNGKGKSTPRPTRSAIASTRKGDVLKKSGAKASNGRLKSTPAKKSDSKISKPKSKAANAKSPSGKAAKKPSPTPATKKVTKKAASPKSTVKTKPTRAKTKTQSSASKTRISAASKNTSIADAKGKKKSTGAQIGASAKKVTGKASSE
jgi:hypothetical protein